MSENAGGLNRDSHTSFSDGYTGSPLCNTSRVPSDRCVLKPIQIENCTPVSPRITQAPGKQADWDPVALQEPTIGGEKESIVESLGGVDIVVEGISVNATSPTTSAVHPAVVIPQDPQSLPSANAVCNHTQELCSVVEPFKCSKTETFCPSDPYDIIRNLDENERWTERTQVITELDHQQYLIWAQEVVLSVLEAVTYISDIPEETEGAVPESAPVITTSATSEGCAWTESSDSIRLGSYQFNSVGIENQAFISSGSDGQCLRSLELSRTAGLLEDSLDSVFTSGGSPHYLGLEANLVDLSSVSTQCLHSVTSNPGPDKFGDLCSPFKDTAEFITEARQSLEINPAGDFLKGAKPISAEINNISEQCEVNRALLPDISNSDVLTNLEITSGGRIQAVGVSDYIEIDKISLVSELAVGLNDTAEQVPDPCSESVNTLHNWKPRFGLDLITEREHTLGLDDKNHFDVPDASQLSTEPFLIVEETYQPVPEPHVGLEDTIQPAAEPHFESEDTPQTSSEAVHQLNDTLLIVPEPHFELTDTTQIVPEPRCQSTQASQIEHELLIGVTDKFQSVHEPPIEAVDTTQTTLESLFEPADINNIVSEPNCSLTDTTQLVHEPLFKLANTSQPVTEPHFDANKTVTECDHTGTTVTEPPADFADTSFGASQSLTGSIQSLQLADAQPLNVDNLLVAEPNCIAKIPEQHFDCPADWSVESRTASSFLNTADNTSSLPILKTPQLPQKPNMADDDADNIPIPKGAYSINWDEIDEFSDPFASKAPPKGGSKLASSPPIRSNPPTFAPAPVVEGGADDTPAAEAYPVVPKAKTPVKKKTAAAKPTSKLAEIKRQQAIKAKAEQQAAGSLTLAMPDVTGLADHSSQGEDQPNSQKDPNSADGDQNPLASKSKLPQSPTLRAHSLPKQDDVDLDPNPFISKTKLPQSPTQISVEPVYPPTALADGPVSMQDFDHIPLDHVTFDPFASKSKIPSSPPAANPDLDQIADPFASKSKIASSPKKSSRPMDFPNSNLAAIFDKKEDTDKPKASIATKTKTTPFMSSKELSSPDVFKVPSLPVTMMGQRDSEPREPTPASQDEEEFEDAVDEMPTNQGFKPANTDLFNTTADWGILETKSKNFKESALSRQSLYRKFDPLMNRDSPISAGGYSLKMAEERDESIMLMGTPPTNKVKAMGRRGTVGVNAASVDHLFAISPTAGEKDEGARGMASGDTNEAMLQVLKYSQEDVDHMVQELKLDYQAQLLAKDREWDRKLQATRSELHISNDMVAKLQQKCSHMTTTCAEYEKTMNELLEEKERGSNVSEEMMASLKAERDQLAEDLHVVESTFSDLHKRFDKLRAVCNALKKNEEKLKEELMDKTRQLQESSEHFSKLKEQAQTKLAKAAEEMEKTKQNFQSDLVRVEMALKKSELHAQSIEQQLQQKIAENNELTKICDNLISLKGGSGYEH